MSIAVTIDELPATLERYPWAFLLTVTDDGRPHAFAVPTDWRDGALHATVGRSARANVSSRPSITMVFPGVDGAAYSLVVDGTATVDGDHLALVPSSAVLHRPALRD